MSIAFFVAIYLKGSSMSDLLLPTNPNFDEATSNLKNLRGVEAASVDSYAEKLAVSAAPALSAKADIIFAAFYGNLTMKILADPYKKKYYDESVWGAGATGGTAVGIMYTAYNNWDAFFKNVTSFHVQGIAKGGGFLQVNWFISNATPVGQFNGAMGGLGLLEAGGPGKWKG